ncbi:hypothetical protein [Terrarubrum flagellatum]|uniref:hypothetical protein n=1 Tax=Terrirubrum flagellatum TaxID=2895980 RepID=UPI0031452BE9
MIVRSAVLEGHVADADKAEFDRRMAVDVRNAIARYPGLRDIRLRWPAETEAGAPPVYVIFDLYFDDLAAMQAALASPVRQQVRGEIGAAMSAFKGKVYHLVLEERADSAAA